MENQYYYKLMANYLSKRNCDESLMRYLFGKSSAKKTPEELERADERKRRLQRERSRRYRALKNARRHQRQLPPPAPTDDEPSDADEPPTLCGLSYPERWPDSDGASDDNSAHSDHKPTTPAPASSPAPAPALSLKEFLSSPNADLDYPTVHSLMFHWLQT